MPTARPATLDPGCRERGFTLVELMVVVAILGVVAALAVYGVARYLRSAKTAEAKNVVGNIGRAAMAAYQRERAPAEGVSEGGESVAVAHALCESALPVPATVPKGRKYQPDTTDGKDFQTGTTKGGWRCLKFEMSQPFYFRFGYTTNGSPMAPNNPAACATDCFEAGANGDLDGDGLVSSFALTGQVNTQTGALITATHIYADSEAE